MLSIVIGTTLAWALVTKAVPALAKDERVARLNEPVDHWNALALLADIAIVLGLWLGTEREHRRAVRVAGALLVYVATLALMLTLSRAGVVVGVVVLALWLVLSSGARAERAAARRLRWARRSRSRAGRSRARACRRISRPCRIASADGAVFGVLALVGAAVVVALVVARPAAARSPTKRDVDSAARSLSPRSSSFSPRARLHRSPPPMRSHRAVTAPRS